MLSRWTNFLTKDGEKQWRHSDYESKDTFTIYEDLMAAWETGLKCFLKIKA